MCAPQARVTPDKARPQTEFVVAWVPHRCLLDVSSNRNALSQNGYGRRRHLGGFRRLSESTLGSSLGAEAAMGASRASWTENAPNSLCFTTKTKNEIQFRLGFLGLGVTTVCVLQHFSADAEAERPCVNPPPPWCPRDAARNPTV